MRNILLRLAYDGTNYHGFQRQPEEHGRTIQGELERVWEKLFAEEIKAVTAGRTDTGVHAAGQVVNFRSAARIPQEKIPKALNSLLPLDIRILEARDVPEYFNARTSAKWKRYDYRIDNGRIPHVFTRLYTLHEPVPLNVFKMQTAAAYLEGKHNFRAFAAAGSSAKSFVRTLSHCKVSRQGNLITITCIGNGFLYNMVRIIAGTLLYVGKEKILSGEIPKILESGQRPKAGETVPATGLTLTMVNYEHVAPSRIFVDIEENQAEALL
ncbi:MAG: tRNA pseudouridine synthase A [Candidatus Dichloromethanomonas elyunquensis]|nr:MAG: tRNA pseudouridine synthase A [Candidatus Dichloromethanomonas elyunquensis]